jgi:hypothetical protein
MKQQLIISSFVLFFLSFTLACQKVQENKLPITENEVDFCSLFNSPEKYESKIIQTKAIVLGYHDFIFYSSQCLNVDKVMSLEINYDMRKVISEANSHKGIYKNDLFAHNIYAEITASGELTKNNAENYALPQVVETNAKSKEKVFKPKYRFLVTELKDVKVLSKEIMPPATR